MAFLLQLDARRTNSCALGFLLWGRGSRRQRVVGRSPHGRLLRQLDIAIRASSQAVTSASAVAWS